MSRKRWRISPPDKDAAAELAEACGISPFLALLLVIRGIDTFESVEEFLIGAEQADPYCFVDMEPAVARIQQALDSGEKMAVYGDYDADGITATALMYSYLAEQGGQVIYYIPEREREGYGLSRIGIDALAGQEVRLIITVDNGISAVEEADYVAEKGIDLVITDHHQPPDVLPKAAAVVNPHRLDCESEFKEYAGVGVAYKLICAMDGDPDEVLGRYGDLVAIGTLADVVALKGENRYLVRRGIKFINQDKRIGIKHLRHVAGCGAGVKEMTASTVLFSLAPRINAAGRMCSPMPAAELLLCDDEQRAEQLAEKIQGYNTDRQTTEQSILKEVYESLVSRAEITHDRVIVVDGSGWNPGVIGIIASRLVDRYGKPCIVLNIEGEFAKGSGRSISGFNLHEAVKACEDVVVKFGGHALAIGAEVAVDEVGEFRRRINEFAAEHYPAMPVPELNIDCKLSPAQIDMEKVELTGLLEPFGAGNPMPIFGLYQMRVDNITPIGQGKHFRLSVSRDNTRLSILKFGMKPEDFSYECGQIVNLAVTMERSEYRGVVSPLLLMKDIRAADAESRQEEMLDSLRNYDRVMRGEDLTVDEREMWRPLRDELGRLYRYLRGKGSWCGPIEQLTYLLGEPGIPYIRLLLSLEVLKEAGLIGVNDNGDVIRIVVLPAEGKSDLEQTAVMIRLK